MANPEEIGKAFVEHYYKTFDTNRAQLQSLYQEQSMLTFEGQQIQGPSNIIQKLTSLPFQNCQHRLTSTDVQPSMSGGLLIFVTGLLRTEGESKELKFSQVFHLAPVNNSFAVSNDLFRLNYG